jgi:hypothetical protein
MHKKKAVKKKPKPIWNDQEQPESYGPATIGGLPPGAIDLTKVEGAKVDDEDMLVKYAVKPIEKAIEGETQVAIVTNPAWRLIVPERLESGHDLGQVLFDLGVKPRDHFNELKKNPEYAAAIEEAMQIYAKIIEHKMYTLCGSGDANDLKKWGMVLLEKYGGFSKNPVDGGDTTPQEGGASGL